MTTEEIDVDPVQHWAMVQKFLKEAYTEAKERVLKTNGLTKKSYEEIQEQAYQRMGNQNIIETQYGNVQKNINGKITWKPLSGYMRKPQENHKLILITKE